MGGTLLFAVGGQSMKIIVSVLSKQTRSPQNALFFFFFEPVVDGYHSLKWTKLCFFKSGSEINIIHTCQRVSSCTTTFFPSPVMSGILEKNPTSWNSFSFSYYWICRLTYRLLSESHFVTLGVRLCQGKLWDHGVTTVYDNDNNIIIIVRVIITLSHMLLYNPKSRSNDVLSFQMW